MQKVKKLFEKENGARHRQLEEWRKAGKTNTKAFDKLYQEERDWLKKNNIVFSPSQKAWITKA